MNTEISVAKALKLKNRLTGRLNRVQRDIQMFNSVLQEQALAVDKVDINTLYTIRSEIVDCLISLKTKIIINNVDIQEKIIRLGELKATLSWLPSINTKDGKERHDYQNTDVVWSATLKKADIDNSIKSIEAEIDRIQDDIDYFNNTKKISVSNRTLDLAS